MVSLVSLNEIKAWLGIAQTDTANDFELQTSLDGASSWITNYTGRTFSVDAADTTRLYYPNSQGQVDVPDLVSVTSIKSDTNGDRSFALTFATTDYELLPTDGPPYDRVRIWPTSSRSFGTNRLVQIVGKFGYTVAGQVPAPVKLACMILASRYKGRKDAPFGVLTNNELGRFETLRETDPDVISLLGPYRSGAASGSGSGSGSWVMV